MFLTGLVVLLHGANVVWSASNVPVPGKPQLDDKPLLLDNYLPASMQVIAYLTDLMKYDISAAGKPQKPTYTTPTSTPPPTVPHKPGYYAPESPPVTQRSLGIPTSRPFYEILPNNKLQRSYSPLLSDLESVFSQHERHFSRIQSNAVDKFIDENIYLASNPKKVLQQINHFDDFDMSDDGEFKIDKFSKNYDEDIDENFLRQKRQQPPTRAYVTLLSLYDLLNKEAKRQGLNKYSGYSENVLQVLTESSTRTAGEQLKMVLQKMLDRQESKRSDANNKATTIITELKKNDSFMSTALRYYPPLQFVE